MSERDGRPEFGIDFGTTNSVVAVMSEAGRPADALLVDGRPHPSIVWYRPDGPVVGAQAKANFNTFAEQLGHRFVKSVKKNLGRGASYDVLGERLPATRVASEIFHHLRADAGNRDWALDEAVVTIPVGFDGRMRQDIRSAAAEAGIHVTKFVHEPFAAVVGYYQATGRDLRTLPDETILVFDWGGGTLDITLARTSEGRLDELATGGLAEVAGDRFDSHIRRWAQSRFLDRWNLRPEAVSPTAQKLDLFVAESERAKIRLSDQDSDVVRLADITESGGRRLDLSEEITRADLNALIADDLQDALFQVDRVLDEARVQPTDVDRVLLIGGTSLIPLLHQEMLRRFGTRTTTSAHSQTVIAEGAAAIGFYGFEPFLARPVQLGLSDGSALTVFDRDTVVSQVADKDVTLYVTDPRDGEARLVVQEQARAYDSNSAIIQEVVTVAVHPGLPRPYNHERVYSSYRIDENLILHVTAHGAARQLVASREIHDLKFGLRLR